MGLPTYASIVRVLRGVRHMQLRCHEGGPDCDAGSLAKLIAERHKSTKGGGDTGNGARLSGLNISNNDCSQHRASFDDDQADQTVRAKPRSGLESEASGAYDHGYIESPDRCGIDPDEELGRLVVAACSDFFAQLESKQVDRTDDHVGC